MKAQCFIDITALGTDEDTSKYVVLNKLLHILHGAFNKDDVQKYAISFPESTQGKTRSVGGKIRIFAEKSMDLYQLIENVKSHHVMRDYAQLSMPKDIPIDFNGSYSTWLRIRVQKKEGLNKEKTIKRATESPFIEMYSSSGNLFQLRFMRMNATKQISNFIPKSYGLASRENMFSLPDID